MNLFTSRRRGAVEVAAFAAVLLGTAVHGQTLQVSYDGPTLDRWMYPFNGTPGIRPFISVFGATGEPDFDDRDGQLIIGFDTAEDVPAGLGAANYTILAASVRIMYDGQVAFVYDDTQDPYQAFLDPDDPEYVPDGDDGQPLELFGVGYRNGFDVASFLENSPYGGVFGEEIRSAHAIGFDGAGMAMDISNNVRDRFDPTPWAVGLIDIDGVDPGDPVPPLADIDFEIDVANEDVQAYLRAAVDDGRLRFAITSLHMVSQQAGSFPTIFARENGLVLDGIASAARLELTVEITEANPADVNGDGTVDVADLVAVILAWGTCSGECPADVNADGIVDVTDLVAVILAWG